MVYRVGGGGATARALLTPAWRCLYRRYVDRERRGGYDLSKCYSVLDIHVAPSAFAETFGLATVEAMAAGVAAVNLG